MSNGFHKWRWRMLTLWVVAFTIITAVAFNTARSTSQDGVNSRNALCALVQDYRIRIAGAEKFLLEHPEGVKGIITATELNNQIRQQTRTSMVLDREIGCP